MENRKLFDPNDIDETLTRVITHGGNTYLLFPYINGTGFTPKFNSVSVVISGPTSTLQDFTALSAAVTQARENGEWFISFNTPWLITAAEADEIRNRRIVPKAKRP